MRARGHARTERKGKGDEGLTWFLHNLNSSTELAQVEQFSTWASGGCRLLFQPSSCTVGTTVTVAHSQLACNK